MNNWSSSSSLAPGSGNSVNGAAGPQVASSMWALSSTNNSITGGNSGYHNQPSMHYSGKRRREIAIHFTCSPCSHATHRIIASSLSCFLSFSSLLSPFAGNHVNGNSNLVSSNYGASTGHSNLKSQLMNNSSYGHPSHPSHPPSARGMMNMPGQPINSNSYMR